MIEVRSVPVIEPGPRGGWQLTFWVGMAFDYTTPFRLALSEITEALGRGAPSHLRLPEYEAGEDFVEGTLQFGGEMLRVYYEHSLGYLSLSTDSHEILRDVAARLQSSMKLA